MNGPKDGGKNDWGQGEKADAQKEKWGKIPDLKSLRAA